MFNSIVFYTRNVYLGKKIITGNTRARVRDFVLQTARGIVYVSNIIIYIIFRVYYEFEKKNLVLNVQIFPANWVFNKIR